MWRKLNAFKDIQKYVITEDKVFVFSKNRKLKFEELLEFPFSYVGYNPLFVAYGAFVYYSNYEDELFQFDINTGEIITIENIVGSPIFNNNNNNNNNILVLYSENGVLLIDLEENCSSICELSNLSFLSLSATFVIGELEDNDEQVLFYNFKDGSSFKFEISSKLKQIVNIKDELVLFLYDDKTISCIDLKTKKEVWNKELLEGISNKEIIQYNYFELLNCLGSDIVYFLAQNYLLEFNANSEVPSISVKNYNVNSELEWYFKKSRLYDDYITFSGSNDLGRFPMSAGVIDRTTKEILWSVKCESGIYFEEPPQIKGNKIYILDSTKTLHIYEKESTLNI